MFSGLADAFKHDATKAVKDGVKEGLNKALDINYDGLNSHRNDMIHHLMLATGSFAASEYKIGVALDRANEGNYQAMGAVANNLNSGHGSMNDVYIATSTPRISHDDLKLALATIESSNNQTMKAQAEQQMRWAKGDNARALFWCGMAARDAAFLTSETAKGLKQAKNLDDIKAQLNEYTSALKDAKQVMGFIRSCIKDRNDARRAYDKVNNIKEPSKKDVQASVNAMGAE